MTNAEPNVVVVTGASGNLGRAVTARLKADGARVIEVERSAARCDGAVIADVDLGDPASVGALFALVRERHGRVDAVVHTVGVFRGGSTLVETPADDFRALFESNVLTTANVIRAAFAVMLPARSGRLAFVASADANGGVAGRSAYGASKGAQLRLCESAGEEARAHGITLNVVLPSTMDTPQNRAATPDADRSGWVSLEAVADVLVYLVSPEARAIHGQAIALGRSH